MRFVILVLAGMLASCATPKTAPQSFYGGVYAPGSVEITETGEFRSRAVVLDEGDGAIARKSAFARLLLKAKEAGYRSFAINSEKQRLLLGMSFQVSGKLYKERRSGAGIYPIDAIKRLLRGLPLNKPKPVKAKVNRSPVKLSPRVSRTTPGSGKSEVETDLDEPMVIMAPEDITGSIAANSRKTPEPNTNANAVIPNLGTIYEPRAVPAALSGIPSGVIISRQ